MNFMNFPDYINECLSVSFSNNSMIPHIEIKMQCYAERGQYLQHDNTIDFIDAC